MTNPPNDLRRVIQRLIRRVMGRDARPILRAQSKPVITRLPDNYADAVRSLSDPAVVSSLRFRKRAVWDQTGSVPDIVRFANALTQALNKRGFPMFVFHGWRDGIEQQRLFDQGVSKARSGQSPHNHGMAVDIIHFSRAWDLTRREWDLIGAIGRETARKLHMDITWGGDWNFYDPAHWELFDWKQRGQR